MFFKTIIKVATIRNLTTICNLIFGILLAYFFGTSPEMDAYVVASNLVIMLNVVFVKAQTKTFIPFIARYKDSSNKINIIASILRFNIITFFLLTFIMFVFSDFLTLVLAPGLDPIRHQTASNILKILSILTLTSNLSGIGSGILEYNQEFSKSALITLTQSGLLIIFIFIAEHFIGIYSVPLAHILSGIFIVFIYLIYYKSINYSLNTSLGIYNPYIKKYLALLFPIMLASIFIWLVRFSDTIIASFLEEGSLSYLSYCQRISSQIAVSTSAICIIYFPLLSKLNSTADNKDFNTLFYKGLQILFTAAIFISLFILLFKNSIIKILFERGNFTSSDTLTLSKLLNFYFLVLICSPLGTYFSNAYFSRQKPKMATILSIISASINIILNVILGYLFGIFGLAAASSAAFLTGNILQLTNIYRINPQYKFQKALSHIIKPFFAGICTFIVLYFLKTYVIKIIIQGFFQMLIYTIIGLLVYTSLFLILCIILRVRFIIEILEKFLKKHIE